MVWTHLAFLNIIFPSESIIESKIEVLARARFPQAITQRELNDGPTTHQCFRLCESFYMPPHTVVQDIEVKVDQARIGPHHDSNLEALPPEIRTPKRSDHRNQCIQRLCRRSESSQS